MTCSGLYKIFTSFFLLLISFMANANVLLWDFRAATGYVEYKFDAVFDDHTITSCGMGTVDVGVTQEHIQSDTIFAVQRIQCGGSSISSKKLAELYVEKQGGFNVWHSEPLTMGIHATGVCVQARPVSSDAIGELGCTKVGASNISCSVDSNNILLEHQTLTSSQLEGNTVTKTISLDCTGDTDALIYAGSSINDYSGSVDLTSDGTLRSNISINGKQSDKNGVKVKINSGKNSFSISSTLHLNGKSISSGSYTGSGVLVIEPQ